MPVARYQLPDGRVARFEVPEGTTPEQAQQLGAQFFDRQPGYPQQQTETPDAQPAPTYNPTEGMSTAELALAGVGKAFADAGHGIKQIGAEAGNAVGLVGDDTVSRLRAEADERAERDAPLLDTTAGFTGNIAGNIAMTAAVPAATTLRGAALAGGALGALQPVGEGDSRTLNTAAGAAAGAGGQKVAQGVGRMISPKVAPEIRALMDEGVIPTPGQIIGGPVARLEEKAMSTPVLGDAIAAGRKRAEGEFSRAAINRVLGPIKQRLPEGLAGREAIDFAHTQLSKSFDDITNRLGPLQIDNQFDQEITRLARMTDVLPKDRSEQFIKVIQQEIVDRIDQGRLTGESIKAAESNLGQIAGKYMQSADADQRALGEALDEAQRSLRSWMERNAPADVVDQLKRTNKGWANFKRVQRAASSLGAESGDFTPAQLHSAVKALDRSKDKSRFARGDALMQDLSEAGKNRLSTKYPDSGTAGRIMNVGAVAAVATNPLIALAASPAIMYTPIGQKIMASALTGRQGPVANRLADLVRRVPGVAPSVYAAQE
jgi:hypothetical protein